MLGVKEGDHGDLFKQVAAAEQAGQVRYDDRDDAQSGLRHRFRFASDLPLNEANPDVRVNFLECWEWDGDQVQHFSWVAKLRSRRPLNSTRKSCSIFKRLPQHIHGHHTMSVWVRV